MASSRNPEYKQQYLFAFYESTTLAAVMKRAFLHVSLPFLFCVIVANTSLFHAVAVDLSYDHYAEPRVDSLPSFLAMPCNCLINVAYALMGLYWLLLRHGKDTETRQSRYLRQVFAFMAIFYAPVQWTRLAFLRPRLARYPLFQRFTGHFWSKVCDVLQFHFSFRFLSSVTHRAHQKRDVQRQ
ncbi:transmembrane protein 187 [Cynoglossus semilaevis]|uniref:transmembrane protein 187 n=1 Tax=Cynoglossus semilaevis TaxID=244447 RepID=UPI0007DCA552|nr:transmembrane protein 187-like [Cynoglossus semilaevis]